jgi:hypothetical protein
MENGMVDLTVETVFPDGPSSNPTQPNKATIRRYFKQFENAINAGLSNGGLIYDTKAHMDADLAHDANASAWVIGDSSVANNGIYRKSGASGSGSWTRVGDLPYSFIKASNAGAGTANAIQATTSIPIPSGDLAAKINLNITASNTGRATVAFNGGAALPIKTNSGADVQADYLVDGGFVEGFVVDGTFRLTTDVGTASDRAAAEAAADAAVAAAASIDYITVADRTALRAVDTGAHTVALDLSLGIPALFDASDLSAEVTADPSENTYVASNSDPTGASGAWVYKFGQYVPLFNPSRMRSVQERLSEGIYLDDFVGSSDTDRMLDFVNNTGEQHLIIPTRGVTMEEAVSIPRVLTCLRGEASGQSAIHWDSASTTTGLTITTGSDYTPIAIRDLKLTTDKVGEGRALSIDATGQISAVSPFSVSPRTPPRLFIDNVWMRGSTAPAVNGWYEGIYLNAVMNADINRFNFEGYVESGVNQSNFGFWNDGEGDPANIWMRYSNIYYAITAAFSADAEGIFFENNNLVAVNRGYRIANTVQEPQVQIRGGHVNAYQTAVHLEKSAQFNISDVDIYVGGTDPASADGIGINIVSGIYGVIKGNVFVNKTAVGKALTGIVLSNANDNLIDDNIFQIVTVGALLNGTSSNNVITDGNRYVSATTRVNDQVGANYLPNQKAVVHRSTTSFAVSGAAIAVEWDAVSQNNATFWVAGSPTRLTAPRTGKYKISANVNWDASTTGSRDAYIALNGSHGYGLPYSRSNASVASAATNLKSAVIDMVAGDYVELFVSSGSATAVLNGTKSWLSIERVGI